MTTKTKKIFPGWYRAVLVMLGGVCGALALYYSLGASGVRVSGAKVSFDRDKDRQLFKIDESRAFLYSSGGYLSVVKYGPGVFPFRLVCGKCETQGGLLNLAKYMKGDWVYSDHFDLPRGAKIRTGALNLKSGEAVEVQAPPEAKTGYTYDALKIPFLVQHGLTFEEQHKLTVDQVAHTYPPLSTLKESCLVLFAAILLVFGIWIAVGLVLLISWPVRRRSSAKASAS
jgi:hypothetical protein